VTDILIFCAIQIDLLIYLLTSYFGHKTYSVGLVGRKLLGGAASVFAVPNVTAISLGAASVPKRTSLVAVFTIKGYQAIVD